MTQIVKKKSGGVRLKTSKERIRDSTKRTKAIMKGNKKNLKK